MYSSIAIANYFLDLAEAEDQYLTPLKLQKLVFIAHGWHLALYKEPLISERVEAWRWGPVISPVYHEFKYYGNTPITDRGTRGTSRQIGQDSREIFLVTPIVDANDENIIGFLNEVWEVYGRYTGIQLANLTHAEESLWYQVWHNEGKQHEVVIDNKTIRAYYHTLSTRRIEDTNDPSPIGRIKPPPQEPPKTPDSKTEEEIEDLEKQQHKEEPKRQE